MCFGVLWLGKELYKCRPCQTLTFDYVLCFMGQNKQKLYKADQAIYHLQLIKIFCEKMSFYTVQTQVKGWKHNKFWYIIIRIETRA